MILNPLMGAIARRIVPDLDRTQLYVGTVAGVGLLLLIFSLPLIPLKSISLLVVLALLCGWAQRYPVALLRHSDLSVSFALAFASLLLLGPAAALWVNLASGVAMIRRSRWELWPKGLFNIGALTLSMGVAGALYVALGGTWPPSQYLQAAPAMALAALSYFALNSVLVAGGIGLSSGQPWPRVWHENYLGLIGHYLGLAVNGVALAAGYQLAGWFGLAVFALPLALARYSVQLYMQERRAEPTQPNPDMRIELGEAQVDLPGRQAVKEGQGVHLTPTEWKVLEALVHQVGTPLSYSQLAQEALGYAAPDQEARDILKVHIHNLRQKLEPHPSAPTFILTVPGFGYTFRDGRAILPSPAGLASATPPPAA